MAERLAANVQADYLSIDDGTLGCEGNHMAVLGHLSGLDTDWLIVLEDDALPCDGFREQADAALTVAPAPIVSFYLGTNRPEYYQPLGAPHAVPLQPRIRAALTHDTPWIVARSLFHAVAVAMPTTLARDMVDDLDLSRPIDKAISLWAETHRHTVAYTNPSLVDHRDTPTLVRHHDGAPRTQPRRAHAFGTRKTWKSAHYDLDEPS